MEILNSPLPSNSFYGRAKSEHGRWLTGYLIGNINKRRDICWLIDEENNTFYIDNKTIIPLESS